MGRRCDHMELKTEKNREKKEMFEEIKTIVAENLGVEEDSITMETSFKDDLKADSLDLFEMVMALEETYGIEIPSDDLGQLETVADVIDYVESHK